MLILIVYLGLSTTVDRGIADFGKENSLENWYTVDDVEESGFLIGNKKPENY